MQGGFAKCYEITSLDTKKVYAAKIIEKSSLNRSLMPSMSPMREPMAAPNTMKYSEVDSTGEAIDCIRVRMVRAISKR